MDYFDLAADYGGALAKAFTGARTRFRIISFTSDWLFPTAENRRIAEAVTSAGLPVDLQEIDSNRGHDAFLLHEPKLFAAVREFLTSVAEPQGA